MQVDDHIDIIRQFLCSENGFDAAFAYLAGLEHTNPTAHLKCIGVFEKYLNALPKDAPLCLLSDLACIFATLVEYKGAYNKTCYRIREAIARSPGAGKR